MSAFGTGTPLRRYLLLQIQMVQTYKGNILFSVKIDMLFYWISGVAMTLADM